MTKDEALKLALEYIETNAHERRHVRWAIKEALAQPPLPVQEPVGSVVRWLDGSLVHGWFSDPPPEGTLLYITPPAAQPECARCKDLEEQAYDLLGQLKVANLKWSVAHPWVGLTDEERLEIRKRKWWDWEDAFDIDGFMQAVETKLKEKNT